MYDIDNMLPRSACTACGKCAEVCPVGCLNIDRHLERIWEYLDSEIAMKTVIFADTNIMKLQENICRVFECSMDRVQAFLHRVSDVSSAPAVCGSLPLAVLKVLLLTAWQHFHIHKAYFLWT